MSQWAKDRANAVAKSEAVSRDRPERLARFWSDFCSTLNARAGEFNRAAEGKSDAKLSIHSSSQSWGGNEVIEATFPFKRGDGQRVFAVAEIIGGGHFIMVVWKTRLTRDTSEHGHSTALFDLSAVGDVVVREQHSSSLSGSSLPLITKGENDVSAERFAELLLEHLLSYSEHFR
jgi:hypothetical protein